MFGGLVSRTVKYFLAKISREYRYRDYFPRLLVENAHLEAGEFIEKEWSRYSRNPLGHMSSAGITLRTIFLAKLWRDYTQLFGSFSEALRAREAFQRQVVTYRNPLWRWKFRSERNQIWIERPDLVEKVQMLLAPGKTQARSVFEEIKRLVETETLKHQDDDFDNVVRGKSVLILGPSAKASVSQEFLDSFDVLAVPKLHHGSWLPSSIHLRSEQHVVTYLNHQTVRKIISSSRLDHESWSAARVKSEDDRGALMSMLDEGSTNPIGVMRMPGRLMMNDYGAFMGPGMLFDILCGFPKDVQVLGFTFYLDADRASYQKSYDSSNHEEEVLIRALRNHGAVSNFAFTKSLAEAGLISLGGETAEALSHTVEQYVAKLDLRFGLLPDN